MRQRRAPVASVLLAFVLVGGAVVACSSPAAPNLTDQGGGSGDDSTGNNGNGDDSNGDDGDASSSSGGGSKDATTTTTVTPDAAINVPTMGTTTSDAGGSSAPTCPYSGTPIDVSGYPSCLQTGRCVPAGIVPASEQAGFDRCGADGGVISGDSGGTGLCLPEKVVAALGEYKPATCTALEGAEGRCLSLVIPSVSAQQAQLTKATCDTNEMCVPCYNPLDGSDTGACETVSCDAPTQPAVTFTACCNLGTPQGKCVPTSLAGSAASSLSQQNCKNGDICAPTENLVTPFVPRTCHSDGGDFGFLFGGYEGVCLSLCIEDPDDGSFTDQGNCDNLHWCAPCNDPESGDPTGAPGCNN